MGPHLSHNSFLKNYFCIKDSFLIIENKTVISQTVLNLLTSLVVWVDVQVGFLFAIVLHKTSAWCVLYMLSRSVLWPKLMIVKLELLLFTKAWRTTIFVSNNNGGLCFTKLYKYTCQFLSLKQLNRPQLCVCIYRVTDEFSHHCSFLHHCSFYHLFLWQLLKCHGRPILHHTAQPRQWFVRYFILTVFKIWSCKNKY